MIEDIENNIINNIKIDEINLLNIDDIFYFFYINNYGVDLNKSTE